MKRLAEQSLYEVLEIPRDATADEVEKAYERAKSLYGPGSLATYTLMDPDEAAVLCRRIEEARAVLLDPVMRAGYDAGLAPEPQSAGRGERPLPPVIPAARAPPPEEPERPSQPPQAASSAAPEEPSSPPPQAAEEGEAAAKPPAVRPVPESPPAQAAPAVATPPPRPELPRPAPSPVPAFSVPEGTPWTGEVLRRVREARGLSLQQIAERTKVTRHHLENIEADRYAKLPAAVYLRGILMSLAKELRLDGQKVARSYLEQAAAAQAAAPPASARGR